METTHLKLLAYFMHDFMGYYSNYMNIKPHQIDKFVNEWLAENSEKIESFLEHEKGKHFEVEEDLINNPSHYKAGEVEAIDVIDALEFNYNMGSCFAYIWRHKKKGDPLADLKKARRYLDIEIAKMEKGVKEWGEKFEESAHTPTPEQ